MTEIRNLPNDWLVRKTSLNEMVEGFRDLPNSARAEAIRAVTQFASKAASTDELWTFSSPKESWERKCGSSGLALLRDGKIAASHLLAMN